MWMPAWTHLTFLLLYPFSFCLPLSLIVLSNNKFYLNLSRMWQTTNWAFPSSACRLLLPLFLNIALSLENNVRFQSVNFFCLLSHPKISATPGLCFFSMNISWYYVFFLCVLLDLIWILSFLSLWVNIYSSYYLLCCVLYPVFKLSDLPPDTSFSRFVRFLVIWFRLWIYIFFFISF